MTNDTNATCTVEVIQAVAYFPLFVLGLLLNTTALWAFVARRHSWKNTHVYVLNLTAADLALVAFLPFRIVDAFHCLRKNHLCTFLISTHYVNMYVSILTSTTISVHRYLAVRFPIRARGWRRKKQKAAAVCLMIWATVVALCFVFRETNYPENLSTCYERRSDKPVPREFLGVLVTLGFAVPLLIVVCCSSRTISILRGEKAEDNSAEKDSIVGIVTANMIVFILCYTPIHVSMLLKYSVALPTDWHKVAHRVLLVSEWVATTNCCLDSICYYFLYKSLVRLRRLSCCCRSSLCPSDM